VCASNCCVVEAGVSWQQESVTAKQGSNISVMCIATDLDFLDVMRVELLGNDGIVRTIADTATVKAPFSHIPRYVITFDYRDTMGNLTVTYRGMLLFYLLPNMFNLQQIKYQQLFFCAPCISFAYAWSTVVIGSRRDCTMDRGKDMPGMILHDS